MSRSIIWGIVAFIIVALTFTAYVVTSSSQEKKVRKDLRDRVVAARNQLRQSANVETLLVRDKTEKLAGKPGLLAALKAQRADDYDTMKREAAFAFADFMAEQGGGEIDLALVNADGDVMYLNGPPCLTPPCPDPPIPTAGQFKNDAGEIIVPALAEALTRRIAISEIGKLPQGSLSRIVTTTIMDYEESAKASVAAGVEKDVIAGALVATYPITDDAAVAQDGLLRVRVVYFEPDDVAATSFPKNASVRAKLPAALESSGLGAATFDETKEAMSELVTLDVGGTSYLAATMRLARLPTKDVTKLNDHECEVAVDTSIALAKADATVAPELQKQLVDGRRKNIADCLAKATWKDWVCMHKAKTFADLGTCPMPGAEPVWSYPKQQAGALVLVSTGSEAGAFIKPAKTFILLLGFGALAIALFGMYLTHRRLESQIDQIELGVAEIINGNLDKTFNPVGAELDGLANGLNVMLARLLGRPEPGEEAFDENGNPIVPGRVDFEEAPEGPAPPASADTDLEALAHEPEPDYYKRLFTEYGAARRDTGSPDDVSFESFIAKLRVNEGKLKAQYQCRAVRFRVVVKDGKVSLKPVPIF